MAKNDVPIEERDYMTVKEFSDATGRFTNNIYDLINHGNAYGKLKTKMVEGNIKIFKSEVQNFVFNKSDAVRKDLVERIEVVERKLVALTYLVEKLTEKVD